MLLSQAPNAQVNYRSLWIESNALETTTQHLVKQLSISYGREIELQEMYHRLSPIGTHYTFEVRFAGLGIYGAEVKINLLNNGRSSITYPELDLNQVTASDSRSITQPQMVGYDEVLKSRLTWTLVAGELRQAQVYKAMRGIEVVEVVADLEGEILSERLLNRHAKPDSTVAVNIFLPDPVTSSMTEYGYPLEDNNDQNSTELAAAMITDSIAVRWDSTLVAWTLQSNYARASDLSFPFGEPPTSADGPFGFNRSDSAFEFVNAYYHLNRQHRHVESIGFGSVAAYAIPFDAHGTEDDQSSFLPTGDSTGVLIFGDGGIDDAEDADVIVHEYGHAFVHSMAPETSIGDERLAIEEGVCDFFALCYSRTESDFGYDRLFNWDGNTDDWHGRTIGSSYTYPSDLDDYADGKYDIYKSSLIWSSALSDVYDLVGRTVSERLLLTSLYSYYSYMTMTDAARLLLEADSLLYDGAHLEDIRVAFCYRGLQDGCQDTLLSNRPVGQPYVAGLEDFAYHGGALRLFANGFTITHLQLYQLNGRIMWDEEISDSEITPLFRELHLPVESSGLYILRITTTEGDFRIKILRNR
ncbi:MAG: hypothetical protein R2813_14105 [Flavobacteriales bacterium]